MIKADNLTKEYRNDSAVTMALNGVSVKITEGEFLAITGTSGSGKSTLMHILGLLDRPTKGNYFLSDEDTSKMTDDELAYSRNKKIGFVFQSFNLLKKTSVLDNVKLPLFYGKDIGPDQIDKDVREAIELVGMTNRINHLTNQLSGGEQQRVAIARALINKPSIILADEPTGNLDTKNSAQIMQILTELNRSGQTIVIVTHEDNIAATAKRKIQMSDGKIIADIWQKSL